MLQTPAARRPPRLTRCPVAAAIAGLAACIAGVAGLAACSDGPHGWPADGTTDGGAVDADAGVTLPGNDAGDGGVNAGPDAAPPVIEGCTVADFAASDATAASDPRLVQVPTTPTPAPFAPRCLQVKVGQTVTFRGDLVSHPLEFDATLLGGPGTAKYTLSGPDGGHDENTVTVLNRGYLTYRCANHPTVMRGAVQVIP